MRFHHALAAVALVAAACASNINQNGDSGYAGAQIDCTGLVCDWIVVKGVPIYGPTWHLGDLGVDLSTDGPIVLELRDVLFAATTSRQMYLHAVLARDPTATLAFECDFYAPGQGTGATFWDRDPVFLVTRHVDVLQQGVVSFGRYVLVPSEGAAVVLRVLKDGTGIAMFDEITLG
jgi:hypothetical protein